jgi:hypothetical protein
VGTLEITHGTFTINTSTTNEFEEAAHFIEHGFFNVVANGFSAHVELENSISLTASLPFQKTIFTIGFPGFQVRVILPCLVSDTLRCQLNGNME